MRVPTAEEALAILDRLQRAGWVLVLSNGRADPASWACEAVHRDRPEARYWANGLFVDMLVNLEQGILEGG